MPSQVIINADTGIAKKYVRNGMCVVAIRFAPGMTEREIRESLEKNPPRRSDWRDFDESTGAFCDGAK